MKKAEFSEFLRNSTVTSFNWSPYKTQKSVVKTSCYKNLIYSWTKLLRYGNVVFLIKQINVLNESGREGKKEFFIIIILKFDF